jgi:hypothetical protein
VDPAQAMKPVPGGVRHPQNDCRRRAGSCFSQGCDGARERGCRYAAPGRQHSLARNCAERPGRRLHRPPAAILRQVQGELR